MNPVLGEHRSPALGRARRGQLLAVAMAVVALLLTAWLVPGDTTHPLPPATTTSVEDEDPADGDGASSPDDTEEPIQDVPAVTYEVYLARDPFEPVVPEDLPQPDAGDPDDPTAPTDPADPSDPGDPQDPADPSDPQDPTDPSDPQDPDEPDRCTGDKEVVCDGQVVSLLDITEDGEGALAVIQVDSTIYEVRTGESFAERFRLLEIGAEQVRVLFGDEDFTLEEDERVLK